MTIHTTLTSCLHNFYLAFVLSHNQVKNQYRRTIFGPFWLTISMAITIACIGWIFSHALNVNLDEYIPFLTLGFIFWSFLSRTLNDACTSFIAAERIIKQIPISFFVFVLNVIIRNLWVLAHHFVILFLVLISLKGFTLINLLFIPGFFLVIICITWMVFALGILCSRYRDLPQIVTSVLQVFFYLTPIIWMPDLLKERIGVNAYDWNPFFHFIELLRAPMLGNIPDIKSWLLVSLLSMAGWVATFLLFSHTKKRIALWL